jgi:hypothetical protein
VATGTRLERDDNRDSRKFDSTTTGIRFAWRNADPDRAMEAMHRGLAIAHDSGNRFNETHLMANLAQLEVERGDPLAALDHIR